MRCLVAILVLGFAAPGAAAEQRFSLAELRAAAESVEHLRIPFRQVKDLELFDQPVVTPGILEISRPLASVRWEFTGRSILVLSGKRLRRWNAEGQEEHVHRGPATQALGGQMRALLTGDWRGLEALFDIRLDPTGEPVVELLPRDEEMARYVTSIRMRFNDARTAPTSLVISAPGGDTTRYEFEPPELPAQLAAARFSGP